MKISASVFALLLLLFTAGCDNSDPEDPDTRVQTADFILEDLQGNSFQLSSTQGKVVVLNFFATTCPICQAEAADMNELYETYNAQGLEVIGIAIRALDKQEVENYVNAFGVPFTVLLDDNIVSTAYRVSGTPDTYFIDRDGFTVQRIQGFKPISVVEEIVASLL